MNVIAIIPARYQSSRFPGKPLIDIKGKSMIHRVYLQTLACSKINYSIVATDDQRIVDECTKHAIPVMMTSSDHTNGTERCVETLDKLTENFDIIINVQGDEPFVSIDALTDLITIFESKDDITIGTLIEPLTDRDELTNNSIIKVVKSNHNKALYFSRQPIPFLQNKDIKSWLAHHSYWKHIGIYGFRTDIIRKLVLLQKSTLEEAESLEQLRWLENGFSIVVKETRSNSKSIDTPEDLDFILKNFNLFTDE